MVAADGAADLRGRSLLTRLVHQRVCGTRSNNLMISFFSAALGESGWVA
jgi:hypothetical protein